MRKDRFVFTSESVTEGHPDKVCDQVSDAVLDSVLKNDPKGRVACESFVTVGLIIDSAAGSGGSASRRCPRKSSNRSSEVGLLLDRRTAQRRQVDAA